jgi:hypothetical protein
MKGWMVWVSQASQGQGEVVKVCLARVDNNYVVRKHHVRVLAMLPIIDLNVFNSQPLNPAVITECNKVSIITLSF